MQLITQNCRIKWMASGYAKHKRNLAYSPFYPLPGFGKALVPATLITFILSKLRPPTA